MMKQPEQSTPTLDDEGVKKMSSVRNDAEFTLVGVSAFLEADPRPTFVVNANFIGDLKPIYLNTSIRRNYRLMHELPFVDRGSDICNTMKAANLARWVRDLVEGVSRKRASTMYYSGFVWTGFVIEGTWTVISGDLPPQEAIMESPIDGNVAPDAPKNDPTTSDSLKLKEDCGPHDPVDAAQPVFVSIGTPDWTAAVPVGELSLHEKFARSIDWGSTPLGEMVTWSPEFKQTCNHMMANPHPAALFWGDDLTILYNQAYVDQTAGQKHPEMFGTGFSGGFNELWGLVKPIFDDCLNGTKSMAVESQMLPVERNGYLEETFYSWSLTPLFGGTDRVVGFYNAPFETTKSVRSARALNTLLQLAEQTQSATSVAAFWPSILKSLEENVFDFPFALLYSVQEDAVRDPDTVSVAASAVSSSSLLWRHCVLEGTLGIPTGHPVAPQQFNLEHDGGGFVSSFKAALETQEPKLVSLDDPTFDSYALNEMKMRGFEEPCSRCVIYPIRPFAGDTVMGFLCIGLNPRRPYDADYEAFINLINRQLATSLAAVSSLEAEIQRGLTAAEVASLERSRLAAELELQQSRLQRIAEVSPVGMFSIDSGGTLVEANETWHKITGHRMKAYHPLSWRDAFVLSADVDMAWETLSVQQKPWSGELQLRKSRYDAVKQEEVETWVLAAAQPEYRDGEFLGIMGCITDISSIKWAENLQKEQLKYSEETRRAQNNFIDITSHEMRNPLTAIVQCADSITVTLNQVCSTLTPGIQDFADSIQDALASAETILLCAQHQKNIVNDILTISKLDSKLLSISPVPVDPLFIVRQTMQMLSPECERVHDIRLNFHINESYRKLNVTTVMLDPSRLLQVLINLTTNAIKFTKTSDFRVIDVSIDACTAPPIKDSDDFDYFPTRAGIAPSNITLGSEWGGGEVLFLKFAVKDSGCGLTGKEKEKLFHRFQQASPKTHVQYGGSGLGLFISRQLTELQGGEIGVASEAGVGSTFAFYVMTRRSVETSDSLTMSKQIISELPSSTRTAVELADKLKNMQISSKPEPNSMSSTSASIDSDIVTSDPHTWHVLIVEDNLINQRILAQQLKKLGCTVHVANHGEEALDVIRKSKAWKGNEKSGFALSVVLMDLEMPVMDGLECIERLRALEVEGQVVVRLKVIAVSANVRMEHIDKARNAGMDSVVSKPFRIPELIVKIEELI